MQARSLNESVRANPDNEEATKLAGELTPRLRLLVLLFNAIPLLHASLISGLAIFAPFTFWIRLLFAIVALYLIPPLVVRTLLAFGRIRPGVIPLGSKDFFLWWITFQWQLIFCRFPALEETLRLVPGLYSGWLRLWGAEIGRLTFWAPGTLILDRSFLRIGDDVIFGAGVRINPHVADLNSEGEHCLLLSPVEIGDRCSIGGYSLLTAGTKIESGQSTKAFLLSPPFSHWRNGKRVRDKNSSREIT